MAYPGHHRSLSDNSPTFSNTPFLTNQTYHPPQDASFTQFEQQPPLVINNRRYPRGRLSPSAGGNDGRYTPTVYRPPIIHYTQPADCGGYNTNLGDLRNQQNNVQSPTGFLNHGQADVSGSQIREAPRNQVGDIPQSFRGAQGHDTSSNNLAVFHSGYEQQPQLGISQAIEPSSRPQTLVFLYEDPSDPRNTNLKAREKGIQNQGGMEYSRGREKEKGHKKKMNAIGGACFVCHRLKKDCDLNLNCWRCQGSGLVCFRGFETLSLHGINFNSRNGTALVAEARQDIIDKVKGMSSANINGIIRELNSHTSSQDWGSEAVLDFRWAQPNSSSKIALDTTLITNFPGFTVLPVSWEESLLRMMPTPRFPHFPDPKSSSILQSATLMLQQFALIISITRAEFYAIPGHLFSGRVTLVFILAYLANALTEKSERFMSDLKQLLKDRKKPRTPYHAWLAIGVYHNIVDGLSSFKPPSLVTEVFSGIKNGLLEVSRAIRYILEVTYSPEFGELDPPSDEGVTGKPELWTTFSQQVPLPPIPESLHIAFYFTSQAPTALARQFSLFDSSPTAISELLSTGFHRNLLTSTDPHLLSEIEEGRNVMPYGNPSSSALTWSPLRRREQSSGADRYSQREAEPDSLRISNRETEISDGEDSTLVARTNVDVEDNHSVPSMTPGFDYNPFDYNPFDPLYFDLKNYYEGREIFHERNKRSHSRGSASSSQSRRNRNKQPRFQEDCETTDYLHDLHPPDPSCLSV